MKIVMHETAKGAVTSTDVREFEVGREYDVPAELGDAFVSMGVAAHVEAKPAQEVHETKPAQEVHETKPAKGVKRKG